MAVLGIWGSVEIQHVILFAFFNTIYYSFQLSDSTG